MRVLQTPTPWLHDAYRVRFRVIRVELGFGVSLAP